MPTNMYQNPPPLPTKMYKNPPPGSPRFPGKTRQTTILRSGLHLLDTSSELHRGTLPGQPSQTSSSTPPRPQPSLTQTTRTRQLGDTCTPNNNSSRSPKKARTEDPRPLDITPRTHASHRPPAYNGAPHTRKRPPEDDPQSTSKKPKTAATSGNGE